MDHRPNFDEFLGKRLKRLRCQKGWTQAELAEKVGVRPQQIHKYETAQNRLTAARLWRIANVFEVSTDDLCRGFQEVGS